MRENKNAIIGIIPSYRCIISGEGAFEAFRRARLKKTIVGTSGSTRAYSMVCLCGLRFFTPFVVERSGPGS